ncbi:hypothetical protein [Ligilactobacillus sp. LYQ60]|uniref:hypothetical protein n=1 Tax=unclassified Ligilactobacillus TaxID=2767920 RepID=UPI00385529C2
MWRVQINADQPLRGNSGTVTVELGVLPVPGDTLIVGDGNAQWRVAERTIIVHDAAHPKKEYVDAVLRVTRI